ncbi:sister chromatid cohesion protein PDS5-like protein isoform X1 [Tanacetum coccineum]
MLHALKPSMEALIQDDLVRHSDVDVRVAVASCISEIIRITAPDATYDNKHMRLTSPADLISKEPRFLGLFPKSNHVDYHRGVIYSSMENKMILVLEESREISVEMLKPLLATVKKHNEAKSLKDFEEAISMVSYGFNTLEEFHVSSGTRDVVSNVKIPLLLIQPKMYKFLMLTRDLGHYRIMSLQRWTGSPEQLSLIRNTGVKPDILKNVEKAIATLPKTFKPHKAVKKTIALITIQFLVNCQPLIEFEKSLPKPFAFGLASS